MDTTETTTAAQPCRICGGKRWLIVALEGDESRDWVQRCDDCSEDSLTDEEALALAARDTHRMPRHSVPDWSTDPEDVHGYLLPQPSVPLTGHDDNAFAVLGRVQHAMRQLGYTSSEVGAFLAEAASGDYDNLVRVVVCYVDAT